MKENKKKRSWKRVVSILSGIVVFCTTYALILPAVTMSKETYCGKEEHVHTEACYRSQTPLCGKEEGEPNEGHVHDETCYELVKTENLLCELEENDEHLHSDECYEWIRSDHLICQQEEAKASEGHTHTDECYKSEELQCGKEEHEHTRICESNKEDVEDPADWGEAYKELANEEDAKTRILTVAKNELGTKENKNNFEVDEEEKEHYYTRYGHLYEDMYGDWNNYFTGYVLKYANVQMGYDKDVDKWNTKTAKDQSRDWEKVEEGNVVFFQNEKDELETGIVTTINRDQKEVKAIAGDVEGEVKEIVIKGDKIQGFLNDVITIEEFDAPLAGTESEEKIEYTWEDEDTFIRVLTDKDTFKNKHVILQVKKLDPQSEEFQEAKSLINKVESENEFAWDIYFTNEKNGKEIEPEKPIQIILTFKDSEQNFWLDTKTTEITHIKELEDGEKVPEEVDQTIQEEDREGYIDSHIFSLDSLSVVFANTSNVKGETLTPTSHIQVEKQFYGLENPESVLPDFKVEVADQTFILNEANKINSTTEGITGNWIWRTAPLEGGTYSVSESGLEAKGYTLAEVRINGEPISINNIDGQIKVPDVTLKDPEINLTGFKWDTPNANKEWDLSEGKLAILVQSGKDYVIVVSKSELGKSVQNVISQKIIEAKDHGVNITQKNQIQFYSIPEEQWKNNVTFDVQDSTGTNIASMNWTGGTEKIKFSDKGGSKWNKVMLNAGYEIKGNISGILIENHYKKDTINFSLLKTVKDQMDAGNPTGLANAKFALKKANSTNASTFEDYLTFKTDENGRPTEIKNSTGGVAELKIEIGQLYQLVETTPPAGYITMTEPLVFKVIFVENVGYKVVGSNGQEINDDNFKITVNQQGVDIVVGNTAGQSLPNTGGAGTQLFTFSGGAIIAASSLMYGYKKRSKRNKTGKGGK
ncbi:SpaA isopeptide-forming pilin-related protein [uncultured Dubosiella sp.]|uniref:SpaA isopeptide-forming pilin-related protein n=3 Tax=uncultured Dubosiella sp. TaxID=1937011 RepID=UPI00259927BE|nr:SpaA isopeptide-forming pilin-related protein [uncultured Dubosiella sp.]